MTVMQRMSGTERRERRAIRPDPGPDRTRECPGESADAGMVVRDGIWRAGCSAATNRDKYLSHEKLRSRLAPKRRSDTSGIANARVGGYRRRHDVVHEGPRR